MPTWKQIIGGLTIIIGLLVILLPILIRPDIGCSTYTCENLPLNDSVQSMYGILKLVLAIFLIAIGIRDIRSPKKKEN